LTDIAARRHRVGVVALVVALVAVAVGCEPRRDTTGWIAYWATDVGRASVNANEDLFSELSPFWYRATGVSTLVSDEQPSQQAQVTSLAKSEHLPLIPAVRDGTPPHTMAAILANPAERAAHVAALVNLVMTRGYAGLDLDYEQFGFGDGTSTWSSTRPNWVQFVAQLSAALHGRGRLLTITVPPVYKGTRAPGSGYWVYDWPGIAPHIDRLRIMAYDFSIAAPGPIAPMWWLESTLRYAVSVVPPAKIQIGVPAYGRSWVTGILGTCPNGVAPKRFDVRMANAATLIKEKKAAPVRDVHSGELTFSYVDTFTGPPPPPPPTTSPTPTAPRPTSVTCFVKRTAWLPDTTVALARAKLVGRFGISGMSQWALGFEDLKQWQPLRDYASTLPHPPGKDPIGRLEAVAVGPRRITVRGWALDPETDLPIAVAVAVGGTGVTVLANGNRTDVARAYFGAGPFHGFGVTVASGAGVRKVCALAEGIGAGAPASSLGCVNVTVPG
jgi:spore germination protein YaaH